MTDPVRVRIAPSPTGTVHLGLARTALFNWAFARRRGGAFVLRIEDTDRERSTAESERGILAGLAWLGIEWQEGPDVGGPHAPYRQSERVEGHRSRAAELVATGAAYPCFCTPERLEVLRAEQTARKETTAYDRRCRGIEPAEARARVAAGEPHVVRFAVPEGTTRFEDLVRGEVAFDHAEVDDWIMVRTGGAPTYNFVVVCDDADMAITHVLRGEEHLVNTPKQLLLYRALGTTAPAFAHLPLMLGPDRKKLSKRAGDVSLGDYVAKGYPRDAIVNFLCLQGWALDGETEVFSVAELCERFELSDVQKGGAVFDFDKFRWLAGEYLRKESPAELADHCAPFVIAAGQMSADELAARRAWFERVVLAEQERIQVYSELPERIAWLFAPDAAVVYDEKAEQSARKQGTAVLRDYRGWLAERVAAGYDAERERADSRAWLGERGLKFPPLFQPLRCALTGLPGGPDLFDCIELLGAERALVRIDRALERL